MTTPSPLTVAIDGPSGSGKSSVSRAVAQRLGLAYLDTVAMYRAATWWCLREGVNLADQEAVAAVVDTMPLTMALDPQSQVIRVDDIVITEAIRESGISLKVSQVATNLEVRAIMKREQQSIIRAERAGGFSQGRGIVAEGRDITTVIAPDANARILLTASEEARLARRATDVHGTADDASVAATREEVVARDARDSTVSQFMQASDGVVTIDSSELTFNQTVDAVLAAIQHTSSDK